MTILIVAVVAMGLFVALAAVISGLMWASHRSEHKD
jgi:hypothetical protein